MESRYSRWKIDAAYLDREKEVFSARGPGGMNEESFDFTRETPGVQLFRMYDGDGELLLEGYIKPGEDYSGFEPLDDYGEGDSGCATISYYNRITGNWDPL